MAQIIDKKVNLKLVGLDGNFFNLIGVFRRQARQEGWTPEEVKAVTEEAMYGGDYSRAFNILSAHCVNDGYGPDDDEEDDCEGSEDDGTDEGLDEVGDGYDFDPFPLVEPDDDGEGE